MKLLFVADGRSPIATNWIRRFDQEHEVHLVSLYPCSPDLNLASISIVPLMFSRMASSASEGSKSKKSAWGTVRSLARRVVTPSVVGFLRHNILPWSMGPAAKTLHEIIERTEPDLVHAMRIPFEGMLTAKASPTAPLVISVWGNDFTWHARTTRAMGRDTTLTLQAAAGVHTDAARDVRLAQEWGFPKDLPSIVLPTGGGIRTDVFYPLNEPQNGRAGYQVINPRGVRPYVMNGTFFRAVPLVLRRMPNVRFVCPAMKGKDEPERWIRKLDIASSVKLLPSLTHQELASVFRESEVAVSPTIHDGTPNTLLECMASGCYPIAGDLESIREWIEPGVNGHLLDPHDPDALAEAMLESLQNHEMRDRARVYNLELIHQRADAQAVQKNAEAFYQQIIANR